MYIESLYFSPYVAVGYFSSKQASSYLDNMCDDHFFWQVEEVVLVEANEVSSETMTCS